MSNVPNKQGQTYSADIEGSPALHPVTIRISVPVNILCRVQDGSQPDCYHVYIETSVNGSNFVAPKELFNNIVAQFDNVVMILVKEAVRCHAGHKPQNLKVQVKEQYLEVTVTK